MDDTDSATFMRRIGSAQEAADALLAEEAATERGRGGSSGRRGVQRRRRKAQREERQEEEERLAAFVGELAIVDPSEGIAEVARSSKESSTSDAVRSGADDSSLSGAVIAKAGFAHLLCPITMDLLWDPVFTSDGHTFERSAIERWLETHRTSPLTGACR